MKDIWCPGCGMSLEFPIIYRDLERNHPERKLCQDKLLILIYRKLEQIEKHLNPKKEHRKVKK